MVPCTPFIHNANLPGRAGDWKYLYLVYKNAKILMYLTASSPGDLKKGCPDLYAEGKIFISWHVFLER